MSKSKLPEFSLFLFGLLFIYFFYGDILKSPNDYMFSNHGDGIKNYFTYSYHISHNNSYTNFEGMNYPYGESHLYTDCHPILSSLFKVISEYFPFFDTHSVGILNVLMVLSIFCLFLVLYLLFVELNLNRWIGVLFTITITVLAPQVFRFEGHFALSYLFAIPISWLLYLKCVNPTQTKVRKYVFIGFLMLNNIFWLFIHAYLGMIILSFLISLIAINFFIEFKHYRSWMPSVMMLLTILLPISVFLIYENLIDLHSNRTMNPSGFLLKNAELDDLFVPYYKPFRPILDDLTGNIIKQNWEARSYVGLVNTLLLLFILVVSIISCFNQIIREKLKLVFNNKRINESLVASIIVLLFAFAFPFKQFPELLECFPIFKSFRATGRFTWPFYFCFSVFSYYFFCKVWDLLKKSHQFLGIGLIALIFILNFSEGLVAHVDVSSRLTSQKNIFKIEHLSKSHKNIIEVIEPDDYQAIISLPFFYYGSESYARPRQNESVINTLSLSYHTGIPCMSTNLTRTSIDESKKIIQILSPTFYDKEIKNDIIDERPFLVIKSGSDFTKYEKSIISRSQIIHQEKDIEILSLTKDALLNFDNAEIIEIISEYSDKNIVLNGFHVSDSTHILYHNDFDKQKSQIVFEGSGSFESLKKGLNELAVFTPNTFEKDKEYDLSVWMYNGEKDALNLWFRLIVEEHDTDTDQIFRTTIFPEHSEVIYGNWSLIEGVFKIRNPNSSLKVITIGKNNSKATFHADELLIKEKGIDVYKMSSDSSFILHNNHRVRK